MASRLFTVCRSFWPVALAIFVSALGRAGRADQIVDFDDLLLPPGSYWNGPDPGGTIVDGPFGPVNVGSFSSRGITFVNRYDLTFGSWSGFAYSNSSDTTTPGFVNQFSAITGTGLGPGQDTYGVAFGYDDLEPNLSDPDPFDPTDPADLLALPYFELPELARIEGMYVTNTTYTTLSMRFGDSFAKPFGGATGNDPDFFKLTVYGLDASGVPLVDSVEFYLADYRFNDNSLDYIVTEWAYLDLSPLAGARTIAFNLSSSDVGAFGMNTPAYFAVDTIRFSMVPEPASLAMFGLGLIAPALVAWRAGSARRGGGA
ncbi:DUF4465 domain-containing protein [Tautonia sociabilis]|nr:DUF4465 domain-containing protein [Tautonia sociabilis]